MKLVNRHISKFYIQIQKPITDDPRCIRNETEGQNVIGDDIYSIVRVMYVDMQTKGVDTWNR